jgi:rRNA maturation endonuclease Nob1
MNHFGAALDRHITGNYGEDQFNDICVKCGKIFYDDSDEEEKICKECRLSAKAK